jgi:hypothetical protein
MNTTIISLGLALLTAGPAAYAQNKKPAMKKPAAAKPAPGPIVLGTTQLPGDFGKLGTTYTIGKREPVNFTLRSAEYSVTPFTAGNNTWVPKADQKLLVLRYTIHNPLPQEQGYTWSSINFTAVDAKDTNHNFIQCVVREGENQPLSIRLKPAQKIDVVAALMVPAEGVVPKLIVEREKGAPVIRFDLRGKAAALPAPIADTADASGATARQEVPIPPNTFAPIGVFDARLDSVAYTSDPLITKEPGKGNRFVTAIFTLKNRAATPHSYHWGNFLATLRDADGEKVPYTQAILKATRDERITGQLAPGEEVRIRFFFPVPEKVEGKSVQLSEGKLVDARLARVFAFDLSTATASK